MTIAQFLLVGLAGLVAGAINSIAGAGSLLTFPALLAAGLPPLQANVTNSIGLVPGSLSGAWGYRAQLRGNLRRAAGLCLLPGAGGLVGAALLLTLPPRVFQVVIPILVAAASITVLAQPWLTRRLRGEGTRRAPLYIGLFVVGVYGGYFGAAQGIMLLAVMGLFLAVPLQRANAFKTLIAGTANAVSGVVFILLAPVAWPFALLLALTSTVGGRIGAALAQRVPDRPLRIAVGIFGLLVAARLGLAGRVF
ncbi:MAG: sulfite exporter TauE/SafE family protein [Candidatus Dormibacteria bacterium]